MKKIIILLLAIMLCLAGVACGSEAEKADKYCWNCGKGITLYASFCEYCGAAVNDNKDKATPTATVVETQKPVETQIPTVAPTDTPTEVPTEKPTATPTQKPTATPTQKSTATPTQKPTATPTQKPTATPTQKPTATPLPHSYGDWVVVKDATENEEGLQERLCVCGDKETKIIDKIRYSEGLSYLSNNSGYNFV